MTARLRAPGWAIVLAAGIAWTGAYFALPGSWQPGAHCAVGLAAAAAAAFAARRMEARAVLPWLLVAAWQLLFGIGDLVLPTGQGATSSVLGFAPWADLCYLAGYAFAVAGVGGLAARRVLGGERGAMIDASIAGIAAGAALWIVVVAPSGQAGAAVGDKVLAVAYPMLDMFLLTVVACIALTGALHCRSLRLLGLGVAAMLAADLELSWERTHDVFASSDLADAGWLLSYALVAAAALHPGAERITQPARRQDVLLTRARRRLLAVAPLLPLLTLALDHEGISTHRLVAVCVSGGLIAALLVWRIWEFAAQQERRAAGDRGLRFAAAELAGASDREGIAAATLAGAVGLVPDACEIRINLLEGEELVIAAAAGENAAALEGFRARFADLAPQVRDALLEHRAAEIDVDDGSRTLVRVSDRTRLVVVYPLLTDDDGLAGWIVAGLERPCSPEQHEALSHLSGLASLSLERASWSDARSRESAETWLSAVIQGSSDVISIAEPDGAVRWISASVRRTLGYTREQLVGTRLCDLLHEDDAPEIWDLLSGDWEPLPEVPVRARVRSAAGSYHHVDLSFNDLRRDPQVRGVVITARDVTEEAVLARLAQGAAWAQLRAG